MTTCPKSYDANAGLLSAQESGGLTKTTCKPVQDRRSLSAALVEKASNISCLEPMNPKQRREISRSQADQRMKSSWGEV